MTASRVFTGKLVLAGESGVGKTTLFNRFHNVDRAVVPTTIAAASVSFDIATDQGTARVALWDTAGQEQYQALAPIYFREATVAVLVFDLTRRHTYDAISTFHAMISDSVDVPGLIVVGNKSDLPEAEVEAHEADTLAERLNGTYRAVCATSGSGFDELKIAIGLAVIQFGSNLPQEDEIRDPSKIDPAEREVEKPSCASCGGLAGLF
jgi:small GTP-binding protein